MVAVSFSQTGTSREFQAILFCLFNAVDRFGRESYITVEVKRLDYGDNSLVSLCNIKQLTPEVAVLPLQALQVSLAHVSSPILQT